MPGVLRGGMGDNVGTGVSAGGREGVATDSGDEGEGWNGGHSAQGGGAAGTGVDGDGEMTKQGSLAGGAVDAGREEGEGGAKMQYRESERVENSVECGRSDGVNAGALAQVSEAAVRTPHGVDVGEVRQGDVHEVGQPAENRGSSPAEAARCEKVILRTTSTEPGVNTRQTPVGPRNGLPAHEVVQSVAEKLNGSLTSPTPADVSGEMRFDPLAKLCDLARQRPPDNAVNEEVDRQVVLGAGGSQCFEGQPVVGEHVAHVDQSGMREGPEPGDVSDMHRVEGVGGAENGSDGRVWEDLDVHHVDGSENGNGASEDDGNVTTPIFVSRRGLSIGRGGSKVVADFGRLTPRWDELVADAQRLRRDWVHPRGSSQTETDVLHMCRAILHNPRVNLTQSFVSIHSGVSQGTLSHYIRGLFRGNQPSVEKRLLAFVKSYAAGEFHNVFTPGAESREFPTTRGRGSGRASRAGRGARSGRGGRGGRVGRAVPLQYIGSPAASSSLDNAGLAMQAGSYGHHGIDPSIQSGKVTVHAGHGPQTAVASEVTAAARAQYANPLDLCTRVTPNGFNSFVTNPKGYGPGDASPVGQPPVPSPPVSSNAYQMIPGHAMSHLPGPGNVVTGQGPTSAAESQIAPGQVRSSGAEPVSGGTPPSNEHPSQSPEMLYVQRRPRPTYGAPMPNHVNEMNPTSAAEQAFLSNTRYRRKAADQYTEALFLPIEVYVEQEMKVLHTFVQWDVREAEQSPEEVARDLCTARGFPESFIPTISNLIRRRLFEGGIVPPVPPDVRKNKGENLRTLKIVVEIEESNEKHILRDSFDWDLTAGSLNSPEEFAQSLCADTGISQRHSPKVAQAIRMELSRAHAVAYGDDATRRIALGAANGPSSVATPLGPIRSAMRKLTSEEIREHEREENEIIVHDMFVKPLLKEVELEAAQRVAERARAEALAAQRRQDNLARGRASAAAEKRKNLKEEAVRERRAYEARIWKEHQIDIKPYSLLKLGFQSNPGIWIEGLLERRRQNETIMPASGAAARAVKAAKQRAHRAAQAMERAETAKEAKGAIRKARRTKQGSEDTSVLPDTAGTASAKDGRVSAVQEAAGTVQAREVAQQATSAQPTTGALKEIEQTVIVQMKRKLQEERQALKECAISVRPVTETQTVATEKTEAWAAMSNSPVKRNVGQKRKQEDTRLGVRTESNEKRDGKKLKLATGEAEPSLVQNPGPGLVVEEAAGGVRQVPRRQRRGTSSVQSEKGGSTSAPADLPQGLGDSTPGSVKLHLQLRMLAARKSSASDNQGTLGPAPQKPAASSVVTPAMSLSHVPASKASESKVSANKVSPQRTLAAKVSATKVSISKVPVPNCAGSNASKEKKSMTVSAHEPAVKTSVSLRIRVTSPPGKALAVMSRTRRAAKRKLEEVLTPVHMPATKEESMLGSSSLPTSSSEPWAQRTKRAIGLRLRVQNPKGSKEEPTPPSSLRSRTALRLQLHEVSKPASVSKQRSGRVRTSI